MKKYKIINQKMDIVTLFKDKSIDFNNFDVINEYLKQLKENDKDVIFIINIEDVIFEYFYELMVIDEKVRYLIKELIEYKPNRVIFLTNKPTQYINMINQQLIDLGLSKTNKYFKFNIYSTNYQNKSNLIKKILLNGQHFTFDKNNHIVYIDSLDDDFKHIKNVFNTLMISFSLFKFNYENDLSIKSILSYIPRQFGFFKNRSYCIREK